MPSAPSTEVASAMTQPASNQKNIWVAASDGDLERVQHLIDVEGVLPNAPDEFTYTPLHASASYGHTEILRYLLNHPKAPSDSVNTTDEDGDTPLFACETVPIARILVEEFHADTMHENKEGNTPAMNAEENGNGEVAEYLRSITGERPLYSGLQDLQDGEMDSPSADRAIEERTEVLMGRVQDVLLRAQARGASSADDLTPEEEEELRRVVGETVLSQIREGWSGAEPIPGEDQRPSSGGESGEATNENDTQPGR